MLMMFSSKSLYFLGIMCLSVYEAIAMQARESSRSGGNKRLRGFQPHEQHSYINHPGGRQNLQTNTNYEQSNPSRKNSALQSIMTNVYEKLYPHTERKSPEVIIRMKKYKKSKPLYVIKGYYILGGIRIFGKLRTLEDCQKLCAISAVCFAGDYNSVLKTCYMHGNTTACGTTKPHKDIVHFKKVPCKVISAPRGIVVLGVSVPSGLWIPGVDTILECIKTCSEAGPGIASDALRVTAEHQACCHIDFNFADHKCYIHPCGATFFVNIRLLCGMTQNVPTPLNAIANPVSASITLCPKLPQFAIG